MRIAIASSGLGHIRRGVETWAEDLGAALRRAGQNVTLFQGRGEPAEPWRVRLACLPRFDPRAERLARVFQRLGGWRYGMGSGYGVEQTTFALSLWRKIRRDYDILHVQDPWLALVLDRLHRVGLSRPNVILGHGTEEDVPFLRKLSNLQHLTPMYDQDWQKHRPVGHFSTGIPNFIDTNRFRPGDKHDARVEWAIPQDAFVVLSVAALNTTYKRCDYVIREFAEFSQKVRNALLVLVGAREKETDDVIRLARKLGGDQVRVIESARREKLPDLYRASDVFVLGSLWEMMPIAVLEALASGLLVICHDTPTLRWMVGDAGCAVRLNDPGALCEQLRLTTPDESRSHCAQHPSTRARLRVQDLFSERTVVMQIVKMYQVINATNAKGEEEDNVHVTA